MNSTVRLTEDRQRLCTTCSTKQYERSVDGLKKQLIELADDGFNGKVLFEDTIHCQQNEQDEELEDDMPQHRGWHR